MTNNAELLQFIKDGLDIINDMLVAAPDYAMFKSVKAQLEAMHSDVQNNIVPSDSRKNRINIGLLAVREFETTAPEFADILMQADYLYKHLV